jgi:hypothetical protein
MGVITWHCRRSSWTPEPRQSTAKGIPRSPSLPQRASPACPYPHPEHLPAHLADFLYPLPFSRQFAWLPRPPDQRAPEERRGDGNPVLPSPPDLFRPPKYLELCPSPREDPGNTKTGHPLSHSARFREGWEFQRVLSGSGWVPAGRRMRSRSAARWLVPRAALEQFAASGAERANYLPRLGAKDHEAQRSGPRPGSRTREPPLAEHSFRLVHKAKRHRLSPTPVLEALEHR